MGYHACLTIQSGYISSFALKILARLCTCALARLVHWCLCDNDRFYWAMDSIFSWMYIEYDP